MRKKFPLACWLFLLSLGLTTSVAGAPLDEPPVAIDDRTDQSDAATPRPAEDAEASPFPAEIAGAVEAARAAFHDGDIEKCQEQFRAAHARNSALAPANILIAGLYLESRQFESARRLLESSAIEYPRHPEVYLLFGKLAVAERRLTDADLQFQHAAGLPVPAPWTEQQKQWLTTQCLTGRALVAQRRNDYAAAERFLSELVSLHPSSAAYREQWAKTLARLKRDAQAHEQFDILHRQQDSRQVPELALAVVFVQIGDYDRAEQWFQEALQKHPDNARLHFERSAALLYQDRADEADVHAGKAEALGLADPNLTMFRGLIELQRADFAAAEQYFANVLEKNPGDADASTKLALALAQQDDQAKRQRAIELAEAAARQRPRSAEGLAVLGWAYFRVNQAQKGEQSLRLALAQAPDDPTTLYFLARVFMARGEQEEGRRMARQLAGIMDRPGLFVFRPEVRRWLQQVFN